LSTSISGGLAGLECEGFAGEVVVGRAGHYLYVLAVKRSSRRDHAASEPRTALTELPCAQPGKVMRAYGLGAEQVRINGHECRLGEPRFPVSGYRLIADRVHSMHTSHRTGRSGARAIETASPRGEVA
jgi:hypothetical protein